MCTGREREDRKQGGGLQLRAERARPACHRRPLPQGSRAGSHTQQGPPAWLWALQVGFPSQPPWAAVSESGPGRRKWPRLKIINMQG